jgi:serine phosphatase RsbU (regulator of sigma subunit)
MDSDPPEEGLAHLGPGDTLVLHTDGLVERRDASLDEGLDKLSALLASSGTLMPDVLCDQIIDRMLSPGDRSDDVALLVLRTQEASSSQT